MGSPNKGIWARVSHVVRAFACYMYNVYVTKHVLVGCLSNALSVSWARYLYLQCMYQKVKLKTGIIKTAFLVTITLPKTLATSSSSSLVKNRVIMKAFKANKHDTSANVFLASTCMDKG